MAKLLAPLIQQAVDAALVQVAIKERNQWATAYGDMAPAEPKAKLAAILLVSSRRAMLSIINSED